MEEKTLTMKNQFKNPIIRKNSTIHFLLENGNKIVRKSYQSTYKTSDEFKILKELYDKTRGIQHLTVAKPLTYSNSRNSIDIEYIQGEPLSTLLQKDINAIRFFRIPVLYFLNFSYKNQLYIDFDPSNIMVDLSNKSIILIDPICIRLNLSHFTAIIFFWGIVKSFFSTPYNAIHFFSYLHIWTNLTNTYITQSGSNKTSFYTQMSSYINTVIGWNFKTITDDNTSIKKKSRCLLLIPMWFLMKCIFIIKSITT